MEDESVYVDTSLSMSFCGACMWLKQFIYHKYWLKRANTEVLVFVGFLFLFLFFRFMKSLIIIIVLLIIISTTTVTKQY